MDHNVPKHSLEIFTIKNNYYVVEQDGTFHYYPIRVAKETMDSPAMQLSKRPPLLMEGLAIIDRKVYKLRVADILRGVIRKSSLVPQGRANGITSGESSRNNTATADSTSGGSGSSTDSTADSDESRTVDPVGVEVDSAADAAWQEQTRALLETLHQKEGGEWEVTDSSQP